ncbi:MAG TPA: BadF/BadG/BcrA/BcrD ATPase family protein [Oleiagrimonas sp.]|nr:BadF/BadG/BcrA/BcrD ATPase family protein [Oleiagrimonas sp.]
MSTILAIDIGRTGCRATLWDTATATALDTASGDGSLGLGAENGVTVAAAAILDVAKPLLLANHVDHVDAVGVGAAGAMQDRAVARQLAQRLVATLRTSAAAVTSDAITSHAGALNGQAGVVCAAGTGAVTVAIGAGGAFRRVDGWGPWLGDEGSGAWLGRQGLQAAARAGDGRGPETSLLAAMKTQFGSIRELAMQLGSDPNPARRMAAFAPAVADAARAGDAVAKHLMQTAAEALAQSMLAAAKALNATQPVPAVILGGLVNMGPVLLDPLHAALGRGDSHIQLQPPHGDAIDGARLIAATLDGIHEPWIARASK